jgi:hypothetical protein
MVNLFSTHYFGSSPSLFFTRRHHASFVAEQDALLAPWRFHAILAPMRLDAVHVQPGFFDSFLSNNATERNGRGRRLQTTARSATAAVGLLLATHGFNQANVIIKLRGIANAPVIVIIFILAYYA